MKPVLLYFEEAECNLSYKLFERNDLDFIILRTSKNLKFFSDEYLKKTENYKVFIADYESSIDSEVERFKTWCFEKNINITHFLNDSEYYVEYTNEFARKFGLTALSDEQTKWVRDKVDMKKRFNEIKIDTVDFSSVENKEDIKQFFIKRNYEPIIFKPRRGMNSIETYKIESLEDIDNLDVTFKKNKYMVEEFCNDHEWSIESLVQDGIVLDSYVTYLPNAPIWATINNLINCHMTVPVVPEFFKFKPKDFIQQIVTGMNLKDGTMTIEVFISQDGNIKASELGWRLPGGQATLNHSISYGIDIYNILIDIAISKKVDLKYHDKIMSVGGLYLPNKEGIVKKITTLEEMLTMDGVINGHMFAEVGKYQIKRRVGNDASGWVQVIGENENETVLKMQNVFDNFKIEVKKEEKKNVKKK